jgi:hypothetical protein
MMMRTYIRRRQKSALWTAALGIALIAFSASAQIRKSADQIITFNAPGAGTTVTSIYGTGTWAFGINDAGAITGWYLDANVLHHSFLRAPDGRITRLDVPYAGTGFCQGTTAWFINQEGAVTGAYIDTGNVFHGFLLDPDGIFTTFDAPDAGSIGGPCGGQGTLGGSINQAGTIAGYYIDSGNVYHGFVRTSDGRIDKIDAPGAGTGEYQGTSVDRGTHVVNAEGAITGYYADANWVYHGFLRAPDGKITTFDAPGAGATPGDGEGTFPMGINADGTITGFLQDTNMLTHGFSRSPEGKFTTFDVPGEGTVVGSWQGAYASDINAEGAITGYYADANWVVHGFLRTPDGRITTFDAPHAGTASGMGTYTSSINSAGVITGPYTDGNGVTHGFLRLP